jgi:hypothetical protein
MARAFVCLVAVLSLAWPRPAPAQAPSSQPARDSVVVHPGTAVIKGRVVEAASNQPVRRVRVHAASTALRDGRTAYTDGDGRYELKALPAGHYTVLRRIRDRAAALSLGDGETSVLDLKLTTGS